MRWRPLVPALAVLACACSAAPQPQPADVIVHNATIYTVDAARPKAEAIAVRGARIALVGANADVLALRGDATRVIDAQGATLVPGIQDAHGHVTMLGAALQALDLRGTTSFDEIVEKVRVRAATARPGEWILGQAWDQNDWADKSWPTHDKLDAAAPHNPVFLERVDAHAALANKRALDAAGLSRKTRDPDGGRIMRRPSGDPSGVLVDNAVGLVRSRMPAVTDAQLEEQILLADREFRRLGLTMVHDAGTDGRTVEAYKRLIDQGKLATRLYVMLAGALAELEPHFARGPLADYGDRHLAVRSIKIVADGALGSRGAALIDDYSDEPGTKGLIRVPLDEIYAQTSAASKAGFQTCIHAIGDRANREVLNIFERVERETPAAQGLRPRIEHAQILDEADIPRFGQLGVIASIQATHVTSDMPWAPTRIGQARADEGAYVWQKLLRSGARIANGSDFPVEEANPLPGFYAAVTRQDAAGQPPEGWSPDQRLSREEMLRSFTLDAAYAAHAEQDLGSLQAGKLADFVMLSKDVMTVPPSEILTAEVLRTVIGGRIVYEKAAGAAAR